MKRTPHPPNLCFTIKERGSKYTTCKIQSSNDITEWLGSLTVGALTTLHGGLRFDSCFGHAALLEAASTERRERRTVPRTAPPRRAVCQARTTTSLARGTPTCREGIAKTTGGGAASRESSTSLLLEDTETLPLYVLRKPHRIFTTALYESYCYCCLGTSGLQLFKHFCRSKFLFLE